MQMQGKSNEIDALAKGFHLNLKNRGGRDEVLSWYNFTQRD